MTLLENGGKITDSPIYNKATGKKKPCFFMSLLIFAFLIVGGIWFRSEISGTFLIFFSDFMKSSESYTGYDNTCTVRINREAEFMSDTGTNAGKENTSKIVDIG